MQKQKYESPAVLTERIGYDALPLSGNSGGYNPMRALSSGNSYSSIADRVLGAQQNYLALPARMDSGIPPKALYGVPSWKMGSGNYSNDVVPTVRYMPMDIGYAHMPSFGSGGAGG